MVEAQILRVSPTKLLPAIRETGPLDSLMDLQVRLLWRLLSANDHAYTRSLQEFSKAQRPLRLDAFEHYVRGLLASEDDPRLRELREAARLEPEWPDPDYAIGDAYYARRDCDSALIWFAKVPKTHDRYVEAVFATGVCRLLMNQPDKAEEVFVSLQEALRNNLVSGADLPEILNNLALARARQNNTPAAAGRSYAGPRSLIPTRTTIPSTWDCWRLARMISPAPRTIFARLPNASRIKRKTAR